jgi:hypothetical protein
MMSLCCRVAAVPGGAGVRDGGRQRAAARAQVHPGAHALLRARVGRPRAAQHRWVEMLGSTVKCWKHTPEHQHCSVLVWDALELPEMP